MTTLDLHAPRATQPQAGELGRLLREQGHLFIGGTELGARLGLAVEGWAEFAACWDGLTLDRHMGDQGRYRLRRYGEFELDAPDAPLRRLPHGPYEQPAYINRLNGGVKRHFDPLEPSFVGHPLFEPLLRSLAGVVDAAQGRGGRWNIRLHPYRILAAPGVPGRPTPEGLHRDGVDYIVTMLVQRVNVRGGETSVTTADGTPLRRLTLTQPGDLLLGDDLRTMHGVSPIECADAGAPAYRDVLVIAYTRS